MKPFPTSIIAKILLAAFFFLLIPLTYYFISKKNSRPTTSAFVYSQTIKQALNFYSERWREGDKEDAYLKQEMSCNNLIQPSLSLKQDYFSCNPYYFECILRNKNTQVSPSFAGEFRGEKFRYEIIPSKDGQYLMILKNGNIRLQLQFFWQGKKSYLTTMELLNQCHQIYLPQRIYSAGDIDEQWRWDNFSSQIYIDKFYVSRGDVELWNKSLDRPVMLNFDVKNRAKPETRLSTPQKKQFCLDRGGQLLQARYFLAASYLPSNIDNARPGFIYKTPYPSSRRNQDVPFFKAKTIMDYEYSKDDCSRFYVKECLAKQPRPLFRTSNLSWMGMAFPLGEYPEIYENKRDPAHSIKLSSLFFDAKSDVHELGALFTKEQSTEEINKQLAFRCMYYD